MSDTVTLIGDDESSHIIACPTGPLELGPSPGLWGLPPTSFGSTRVANIPGERLDDTHTEPRDMPVPLQIRGDDHDDLVTQLGTLQGILRPGHPIRLVFARGGGTTREIVCYCVQGAEAIEITDHEESVAVAPLILRAYDPWWRDFGVDEATYGETFDNGLEADENPFSVVCASDIDETWPEITIDGPIENVHFAHRDLGRVLRVTHVLPAGQQIRIVTDPARRDVWLNGEQDWTVLDPAEMDFFPLIPGTNALMARGIDASGAATPGSFELRWSPRYSSC